MELILQMNNLAADLAGTDASRKSQTVISNLILILRPEVCQLPRGRIRCGFLSLC